MSTGRHGPGMDVEARALLAVASVVGRALRVLEVYDAADDAARDPAVTVADLRVCVDLIAAEAVGVVEASGLEAVRRAGERTEPREPVSEAAVKLYLDSMRARNLRPKTIYAKSVELRRIGRQFRGPLLRRTADDLIEWQAARVQQVSPATLRCEMSALRGFYAFAVRRRLIRVDPMAGLDMPRVRQGLPRPIADAKVKTALASAGPKVAAILALAGFAGLRACEIAVLDWRDVDLTARLMRIDGKGGKERSLSIPLQLVEYLSALPGPRRGPVIRRATGGVGPNMAHRISSLANEHLHAVGFGETLHTFRHRFATSLLEASHDIALVADGMGHASAATTAIYAKVSGRRLRDGMDAAAQLRTGSDAIV